MPRPISDDPKIFTVSLRLTKSERAKVEKLRGKTPLTDFLRARIFGGR